MVAVAVQFLYSISDPQQLDPLTLLELLQAKAITQKGKADLAIVMAAVRSGEQDDHVVSAQLRRTPNWSSLHATETVCVAIWMFVRYFDNPVIGLIRCVAVGGDTDTIAAMCGALFGCLFGTNGMPQEWYESLEEDTPGNKSRGRQCLVKLGKQLAQMDPITAAPALQPVVADKRPAACGLLRLCKDDENLVKYFKMKRMRIPDQSIKEKMKQQGHDPTLLDTPDAPSPYA